MTPDDRHLADRPRLHRTRDFGEVVTDAFTLLFSRGGAFFPAALALLAVPLMLAALGEVQGEEPSGLGLVLSLVGSIAGSAAGVLMMGAAYTFVLLLDEEPEAEISAGVLWSGTTALFWPLYWLQWVIGIIVGLCAIGLMLPGLITESPVLLGGGVVAALVAGLAVLPGLSLALPARVLESGGAFEAIGRGLELVKGHWKQSFGVVFVTNLIAVVAFLGPMLAVGAAGGMVAGGDVQSPVFAAFVMIGMVGYAAFALPAVAGLMQYVNLVERREAPHLDARVEEIGEAEAERPLF